MATKLIPSDACDSPPDEQVQGPATDTGRRQVVVTDEGKPVQVWGTVSIRPDSMWQGGCIDLKDCTNTQAITASSAEITAPIVPGDWYYFIAVGNSAYIRGSGPAPSNNPVVVPTATTTAGTGFSLLVPEGACLGPFRIGDRHLSVIGSSAAGTITTLHITAAANPL